MYQGNNAMAENRLDRHWSKATADAYFEPLKDQPEDEPTLARWTRKVEQFLGDHPEAAVVAALAVGLTLGWMVKRK